MASSTKCNEAPSDQEGSARKSFTQDHARQSNLIYDGSTSSSASLESPLESPLAPVEQPFTYQGVSHPISPPSSPYNISPELSHVINQIKALTDGSRFCTPYWSEFYLSPQDFEELQIRERRHEFEVNRLRYDYSAGDHTFALRMPTYETHEVFLRHSDNELQYELNRISLRDGITLTTAEFVKGIINRGSATIYYPPPFSTITKKDTERSPDLSWAYRTKRNPSCIFEIAHSQTTKNLTKLAEEYIWGTNADVRTVVGFDFNYQTKGATLSIWRSKLNEEGALTGIMHEVVEIRNKDGQRNQDTEAGLRLSLEDFAFRRPSGTFDGLDQVSIFIPVSRLCDMLEEAEEQYRIGTGREGSHEPGPPAVRPDSESSFHRYPLRSRR